MGNSAVESGIHLLPMVLAIVVASITTGILTSRVGYYTPFLIIGICISSLGAGLLNTLETNTSAGKWIGFQILYGFGLGASFQAPNMAAQTVLPRKDVSIGVSLMLFTNTLFGAIFVSVGQNVLDSQLISRLAGISSVSSEEIQTAGVTGVLTVIPPQDHAAALGAYNDSLRTCFEVALILACISIIGGLTMEWRSVKKNPDDPEPNPVGPEQAIEEGKNEGTSNKKKQEGTPS
jgi:MFS family permease